MSEWLGKLAGVVVGLLPQPCQQLNPLAVSVGVGVPRRRRNLPKLRRKENEKTHKRMEGAAVLVNLRVSCTLKGLDVTIH